MNDAAGVFAAAAALLAAALSGITLYVTGKRDERRWRREQLVDAYQELLDISFRRSRLAVEAVLMRQHHISVNLDKLREEEERLHSQHNGLLTRIRLLGPQETVRAAQNLHNGDHSLVDAALADDGPLSDREFQSFESARQLNLRMKQAMFDAARRTIGLGSAAEIEARDWGTL